MINGSAYSLLHTRTEDNNKKKDEYNAAKKYLEYYERKKRADVSLWLYDTKQIREDIEGADNALKLSDSGTASADTSAPVWAQDALSALDSRGIHLDPTAALTRSDAALILYQASKL